MRREEERFTKGEYAYNGVWEHCLEEPAKLLVGHAVRRARQSRIRQLSGKLGRSMHQM